MCQLLVCPVLRSQAGRGKIARAPNAVALLINCLSAAQAAQPGRGTEGAGPVSAARRTESERGCSCEVRARVGVSVWLRVLVSPRQGGLHRLDQSGIDRARPPTTLSPS